ncbi:MAG: hypothetical protein Q9160_007293 [Pyrenula sp. 1 TL-2023]
MYSYPRMLSATQVIAHECGHSAFSPSDMLNHTVGFILHSSMLTPYFSWRSTHRRHHIYANNLSKDHNYVPPRRDEYALSLRVTVKDLEEMVEDAPIVTCFRIMTQQLLGFPWYLANNITAAEDSLPKPKSSIPLGNSHFAPWGSLFRKDEALLILMSDIGLAAMAYVLYMAGSYFGSTNVALLYLQPYFWVNHWIVCITYMQHTHPDLPKFENDAWTFLKGATATVDRKFDWFGKHLIHNIVDFHVIHHLFPLAMKDMGAGLELTSFSRKIPFYHAEEATRAIQPLLGKSYHEDKQRMFLPGLWESFTKCQWVETENPNAAPKDRVMKYRAGPSPPPETAMGIKGLFRQARSVSSGIYAKW